MVLRTRWVCPGATVAIAAPSVRIILTAALAATVSLTGLAGAVRIIEVSDAEALYATVNDPANAGAEVVLAAGRYALTAHDANGIARPNGGRLELQPNMSLSGVTDHPEDVVIDASGADGPDNPIRIGWRHETIEWLTAVGRPTSQATIATDLVGDPTTSLRIAHVIATGSIRGIDVRNASGGRTIVISLDANELTGNLGGNGQGIRIANVNATGASIVASLRGNWSHGNRAGCLVANLASSAGSIAIDSHDDRFENNAVGCVFLGGITQKATDVANDNSISVTVHAGTFANNAGFYPPNNFTGGLAVVGGQTSPVGSTSRNAVHVSVWGTTFDGQSVDVSAWGADTSGTSLSGIDNVVSINLHGVSQQALTSSTPSNPPDPSGTNVVTIVK